MVGFPASHKLVQGFIKFQFEHLKSRDWPFIIAVFEFLSSWSRGDEMDEEKGQDNNRYQSVDKITSAVQWRGLIWRSTPEKTECS